MQRDRKIDPEFTALVTQYLDAGDDIGLFTHGCCCHFALRLHYDRGIRVIDGCSGTSSTGGTVHREPYSHVWLAVDDRAFDVTGVYDRVKFNQQMQNKYTNYRPIESINPELIRARIEARPLPFPIFRKVNVRALWIFDNDPKFAEIRQMVQFSR